MKQAQSVNVNFDAVRGGFMFLRGCACLALQRFEQGGLADVAFADQHQFGFVERLGVLFETAELGFDCVQTLFVCALQGGVEGVVFESDPFQMLQFNEGRGEVGKIIFS